MSATRIFTKAEWADARRAVVTYYRRRQVPAQDVEARANEAMTRAHASLAHGKTVDSLVAFSISTAKLVSMKEWESVKTRTDAVDAEVARPKKVAADRLRVPRGYTQNRPDGPAVPIPKPDAPRIDGPDVVLNGVERVALKQVVGHLVPTLGLTSMPVGALGDLGADTRAFVEFGRQLLDGRTTMQQRHRDAMLAAYRVLFGYEPEDAPWARLGHDIAMSLEFAHRSKFAKNKSGNRPDSATEAIRTWRNMNTYAPGSRPEWLTDAVLTDLVRRSQLGRGGKGKIGVQNISPVVLDLINEHRRLEPRPLPPLTSKRNAWGSWDLVRPTA
jgi:hypothetical protein